MNLGEPDPQQVFAVRLLYFEVGAAITAIGYLLGSIPFGLIVAKAKGVDIRQHGSGNIGATNVMRTLGKKAGYTVFACDALKGIVAVILAKYIADHHAITVAESHKVYDGINEMIQHATYFYQLPEAVAAIMGAVACILGHNFPIWLKFKGGKGMATSCGVLIAMMPSVAASCVGIWLLVFFTTRYVSLASIAAAIALPLSTLLFLCVGFLYGWPYFYFAVLACFLAVWRHRSNIVRLVNGTESRFVKKPKPTDEPATVPVEPNSSTPPQP